MRVGARCSAVLLVLVLTLAGCSSPSVVKGSTVTVAQSAALFSLNNRTSYGNSAANSSVLQAVDSSFNRYDDASNLVTDPSFGNYQLLSNDPLTVKYTIADGVTWSDGVPVDAADLLLAWVANSGALNTKDVNDAPYRDSETGRYATPFPKNTVYFDGATSEGLQYVTKPPQIGDGGRSLTLTWDRYVVDWPLLLQVGQPAHVVASHALGLPLPHTKADEDSEQPSAALLSDAKKAKVALIAAIQNDNRSALSSLANFWNDGFNIDAMPSDHSLLVSTGPYTITGFAPGKSVTLTANARYHGAHTPAMETIVVRFLADPLDQVAALADGSADVIVPRPTSAVAAKVRDVIGATLQQVPGGTYEHLDLKFAHAKHATFDDRRVREAFLKTIPTEQIRDAVLGSPIADAAERSSLVFLPGSPGYQGAVVTNGSARFSNADVAGAKALLTDAGVPNPTVCILFDPSNPKRVKEFQLIADAATVAGFVVTNCSGPDSLNLLGTPGTYDAAIFGWSTTNLSAAGIQSIFGTGGRGNFNSYSNPAVDALLSQLAVTPAAEAQRPILADIDTALYSDAYGLPLYQDPILVAHNKNVTGIMPAPLAPGILWNVWAWAHPAAGK